ncbi:MAG: hypothetical protein IJ911_04545 [Salinivirgaceae bacterium]|nr:hypothetical protein [Salinivirgaceae bacterium]
MKKFGFKGLAALALAATTVFSSCKKDDDGNSVIDLLSSFEVTSLNFKTNVVYGDKDESSSAAKSSSLFGEKKTTVYAVDGKQFISVVFAGDQKGTYNLELKGENPNTLLINYLTTDATLDETLQESFSAETGCLITYGSLENGASADALYVSTKASVTINSIMKSTKVGGSKVSGTFTATLVNSKGDKKEVEGKFNCLGL